MFNKPEISFGDNSKVTSKVDRTKGSSQMESHFSIPVMNIGAQLSGMGSSQLNHSGMRDIRESQDKRQAQVIKIKRQLDQRTYSQ